MRLLGAGVGMKLIGDLLGHRSLASTGVYLRIQLDMLRGAALEVPAEWRHERRHAGSGRTRRRLRHIGARWVDSTASKEWLLRTVVRDLQAIGHDDITESSFSAWFDSRRHLHPNTRGNCAQMLRHFCLHRRRTDPGCFVPPPELACRAQPVTPVIRASGTSRMLATAAALEPSPNSPLRPAAMRMFAVALLYTTGLRVGELQRLALGDVQDGGAVLHVRASKFHKSRLLPPSAEHRAELLAYLDRRAQAGFDTGPAAPLLCQGPAVQRLRTRSAACSRALNRLLRARAALVTNDLEVHDLRHTFTVQALARWYRLSADVQAQLPKLSMCMGHASIDYVPDPANVRSSRNRPSSDVGDAGQQGGERC